MSKNKWPILYSKLLYKMDNYFLDIKYRYTPVRTFGLTGTLTSSEAAFFVSTTTPLKHNTEYKEGMDIE